MRKILKTCSLLLQVDSPLANLREAEVLSTISSMIKIISQLDVNDFIFHTQ
jgi:hypothetical protein